MQSLFRVISAMTRTERIVVTVLGFIVFVSFLMLLRLFYVSNTTNVGAAGGTYIEGAVGELQPMMPWFTIGNDVTRDVNALIFAGLMKYDPVSGKVIDDLATVKISNDSRVFTATLKPGLNWHDGTPVTAEDVLFNFDSIQQPGFRNPILQQNFKGVTIEKIDDRTVRFSLKKPYVFFTSNLTLGLVPKHAFEGVPPNKLDQALDFGFHPIGAGPYSFLSLVQTDFSTEVTLKHFPREGMPTFKIERVVFRVFPDYSALLTDILNINGVRLVPRNDKGLPIIPRNFTPAPYTLPQYVGLFFNMSRPTMADRNVRLALQLATNKKEIADAIGETHVVDTPLLEVNLGDWTYSFDAKAAKGAFFDSSWNMPEKIRLQRLLEQRNTNRVGALKSFPRLALLGTGSSLTLTGSTADTKFPVSVNGIRSQTGSRLPDGSVMFLMKIPAGDGGSGSLKVGLNVVKMTNADDDVIDSAYVERFTDPVVFARAMEEQRLVDAFLLDKQLPDTDPKKITVSSLYLEHGYLRRKLPSEAPHTRINEKGKELTLTLLTTDKPETYRSIAGIIKAQWETVGVKVIIDVPATRKEFENRLLKRDYDVVLFGESLFDNLDSYPYWHSSQIQELTDPSKMRLDALNLSQYASFEADLLLTRIRETGADKSRENALKELNTLFKKEIPALTLYSPLAIYAHDEHVHGVTFKKPSVHADRFSRFDEWYVTMERQFTDGKSWLSFPGWLLSVART
ncbi:MAG: ABC transporter substrate-binding protein [Candidatus Peribacteraceae bacterium]|nr:ABC transporter substrate-binding protein [Candidatus Peribacteraceae bacterium]